MTLHLVGETIDAATVHHRARRGELTAIVHGVYIEPQAPIEALLREHLIRIAHYLYPSAYLCAASAVTRARRAGA